MKNAYKCPVIKEELIKYLDGLFPDKCPELKETEKEVFYKAGQRSVVNHLLNQFKIQQEN